MSAHVAGGKTSSSVSVSGWMVAGPTALAFLVQFCLFAAASRFRFVDADEGAYLTACRLLLEGQVPYGDFFFPQTPFFLYIFAAWGKVFGISWYSTRRGETVWVGHAGAVEGFMTYAGFLPEKKLGVIVLVNGVADPTDVALGLGEIALEVVRPPSVPSPPAPMTEEVRDLPGLYFCERHGMLLRVEWRAGTLQLVYPEEPEAPCPTLSRTDERDVFVVHTGRDAGESAVFLRVTDGRVCGVRIAAVSYTRLAPVVD